MRDNSEKSAGGLSINSKAGQGNNTTWWFSLAGGYRIQINYQLIGIKSA